MIYVIPKCNLSYFVIKLNDKVNKKRNVNSYYIETKYDYFYPII